MTKLATIVLCILMFLPAVAVAHDLFPPPRCSAGPCGPPRVNPGKRPTRGRTTTATRVTRLRRGLSYAPTSSACPHRPTGCIFFIFPFDKLHFAS